MSALANALSTGKVYWPSPSDKTDAAKICFCPCGSSGRWRFRSYANKARFMRSKLAGCCCTCSDLANLYSLPSTCVDVSCSPLICNFAVSNITATSALLSWSAPEPYTYNIYLGAAQIATGITATTYSLISLTTRTTYTASITLAGTCESAKITVSFTTR